MQTDNTMKVIAWMITAVSFVIMVLSAYQIIMKDIHYNEVANTCTALGGVPIVRFPENIVCLDREAMKRVP